MSVYSPDSSEQRSFPHAVGTDFAHVRVAVTMTAPDISPVSRDGPDELKGDRISDDVVGGDLATSLPSDAPSEKKWDLVVEAKARRK